MDFSIPSDLKDLADRIGAFVRSQIIPLERDPRWGSHGPSEEFRLELVARARAEGLLAPHVPTEFGGLGLSHFGRAVAFEAAGYSMLGPVALHCAAPDEGNMHLLAEVADGRQKERWLRPLASGESRSCFAMTEPMGAGSDPALLGTVAEPVPGGYRISGRKWLITGAEDARFAIIMAKLGSGERAGSATMFLADMDQPEIVLERQLDTIDSSFTGGHWVIRFDGLFVPEEDVLGAVGEGFRYAQVRLAPARLTHCMRWLGSAVRAHDIARDYAQRRTAFGKPLAEHEGVGFMLADNDMDIHVARLAIWHTAWVLDQGGRGNMESSRAKVICSEAVWRVADRCVQILGGLGLTRDTVVERIFRDIRAFRVYDGPSEVHRWSLARRIAGGRH
ncbi:acyl-CoA dehydrogenase family protein [Aquibium microcysteis]|uniref:acyl-CoA dehydrogenase family protein n=1 Tax=Aquibium microcysteis TaxID=675281 RepID=UPI00165D1DA9|nr:acyl-CoA dehydrogenase family protein [Aquibium microcysteis]